MQEIFIEKGFNDILAKPIDIFSLEEILLRWIPENKRVKGEASEEMPDSGVRNVEGKTVENTHNSSLKKPRMGIAERIRKRSKFFITALYTISVLWVLFVVWNEQNLVYQGSSSPAYRNLREFPAYAKKGFTGPLTQEAVLRNTEFFNGTEWGEFSSSARRIINSTLDLPERTYLSPFGKDTQEFTIVFLIEIDDDVLPLLKGGNQSEMILPGISFAGIGENWEIFFNDTLIRSEIHLNEVGRITSNRVWRDVHFPLDSSLFVPGTNFLTLRIVGDPTYLATGLFYSRGPIYMDDYQIIENRHQHTLIKILCGIFGFVGIYYLMLFFTVMRKDEMHNFYYGLFSILLCIYSITRHGWVNTLIPNSYIAIRLEYLSLMMSVPLFCMGVETLIRGKITKITWGYFIFCAFLSVTQIFFSLQYGEEVIALWNYVTFAYYSYVLFYEILYIWFWGRYKKNKQGNGDIVSWDISIDNILIGSVAIYICGALDIIDALYLNRALNLFQYSTFAVQFGMAVTLMERFSRIYNRLEQSNILLETKVQERTLELKEQTEIALNASNAKSRFLATVSHEIRTPLNAVIGFSEIELKNDLPEKSKFNLSQIHQSSTSLLGIINDILDISKIEAGSFQLIPAEYWTASLINDVVNQNIVRIGSKPIEFILDISGDFPAKLYGDELRIKQILNNILSNAFKYTMEGTVKLEITNVQSSFFSPNSSLIRFVITDTGIGIRKEDFNKLFSDYSKLDEKINRQIEGTGLGLVITKKLVEMMDGSINVESEYGKGSVFSVELLQVIQGKESIGEKTAEDLRNISYVKSERNINTNKSGKSGENAVSSSLFGKLAAALKSQDAYEIDRIMEELGQKPLDLKEAEILKKISGDILMAEYENALKTINENLS